ncbi:NTP pyrophosphohydrolase MazG, putative catalytic core [uncultured Caudovirales phage]|uniref:NTP pyrophosphohydrolase MazG, putative catalytic core n=1 Tax=uncultured Caudovirales phage TaxID=2100421 RepID=A0A6J5KSZ4_9CAUD|nr:NTP pyrophosphohydrolase MazG, putative catalytic core [uncultured Caudovirales phage]
MISNGANEALVILAEECSEVVQAVAKIHRWGPQEWYGAGPTNLEKLATELGDVKAMIDIAIDQLGIDPQFVEDAVAHKKIKLKKYSKFLQHYV